MTAHRTFFFREPSQLAALAGPLLDEFLTRSPQVRLWSAACSTGEEAYSLAIALLRTGKIAGEQLTVRATDVAPAVLEQARTGVYADGFAFRVTEPVVRDAWFHPHPDGLVVAKGARRVVSFGCVDLLDARAVAAEGLFDAIVCRNMLIFLADDDARRTVVESLARALRPGGYLFVGEYESAAPAGSARYEPVELSGARAFRRRAAVQA